MADLEALLANLPSTETDADAALAGHQLTVAVRAAVARLPARYRRPLVLYHLDGLRQERIATVLGVAPGTIRSLVTRARQALRSDLEAFSQEETAMRQARYAHPSAPHIIDELLREPLSRPFCMSAMVGVRRGHSRNLEFRARSSCFPTCCSEGHAHRSGVRSGVGCG